MKAAKSADSQEVEQFPLELIGSSLFGRPKGIRTDGGAEYDNKLIDALMLLFKLGVNKHHDVTLAYRPEAHGKIGRVNREVGKHLRMVVLDRRVRT